MRDNQNPCRKCHEENRSYEGCHGKCQEYKDWKEEYDRNRLELARRKQQHIAIDLYRRDAKAKVMKAKGR